MAGAWFQGVAGCEMRTRDMRTSGWGFTLVSDGRGDCSSQTAVSVWSRKEAVGKFCEERAL